MLAQAVLAEQKHANNSATGKNFCFQNIWQINLSDLIYSISTRTSAGTNGFAPKLPHLPWLCPVDPNCAMVKSPQLTQIILIPEFQPQITWNNRLGSLWCKLKRMVNLEHLLYWGISPTSPFSPQSGMLLEVIATDTPLCVIRITQLPTIWVPPAIISLNIRETDSIHFTCWHFFG